MRTSCCRSPAHSKRCRARVPAGVLHAGRPEDRRAARALRPQVPHLRRGQLHEGLVLPELRRDRLRAGACEGRGCASSKDGAHLPL